MKNIGTKKNALSEFRERYTTYHSSLCLFAKRYVQELNLSKDIVQEVFIKIWENEVVFDNENSVKSYLYNSVRNKSLDYLKSSEYKRKSQLTPHDISFLESDTYFEKELLIEEVSIAVNKAVNTLPHKCREIILLSLNGLRNEQISEELCVSVNTVKTQKRIAYQKLRPLLKGTFIFVIILK